MRSHSWIQSLPWLILFGLALSSCIEDPAPRDHPDAIQDLSLTADHDTVVAFSWTAPGGGRGEDQVFGYDLRYARTPLGPDNWDSATQIASEPSPKTAGRTQSMNAWHVAPGETLYFAMRSLGRKTTWSELSNVVMRVPPVPRASPFDATSRFAWHESDPHRNLAALEAALDPGFRFHFTSQDSAAMGPGFPGYWTREEFLGAMSGLMGQALDLHLAFRSFTSPDTITCEGGTQCVQYRSWVRFTARLAQGMTSVSYRSEGDVEVTARPDPNDARLWVLGDIVDGTLSSETWGHVLAPFGGQGGAARALRHP